MLKSRTTLISLTLLAAAALAACGGDNPENTAANAQTPAAPTPTPVPPASACAETGVDAKFACQTGATEPLYIYQWALKQATSYFKSFSGIADGVTDLNVEDVHAAGIKGQGVNVLVLDDGVDIGNEDLAANVNRSMTYNFDDGTNNPTPANIPENIKEAHGTHVAGIISAAQNGKGVIGIAPRATLGGARFIGTANANILQAYGGADWSRNAHIINASYGGNPVVPDEYDTESGSSSVIRAFPNLRSGKGLVMVKASGNEYNNTGGDNPRFCPDIDGISGVISCENPANDTEALEPGVILVGAANAKGMKSSYSNAGAVNWITGLGGEFGEAGQYGELGSGPMIFSTDLSSCARGYSRNFLELTNAFSIGGSATNKKDNANCDYSSMNGTSAATPTISGVVSLMLAANPNLTWRDVREILRVTARRIDPDYGSRNNRNLRLDLKQGTFTASEDASLVDGSQTARLDLGWQKNAAGNYYSNWYGFGLADAAAAVRLAKAYGAYKPATLAIGDFTKAFADSAQLKYGSVQKLGQFTVGGNDKVDALQLRLSGSICVGSVGVFVKSPSGTISALAVPYNSYYSTGVPEVKSYGLGSYAFHGENAAGNWEVYAVSVMPATAAPGTCSSFQPEADGVSVKLSKPLAVEYRVIAAK
ncbi:S8 family serine peptidase [Cupriavidus sp. UME77]|uniref:S8 family peptidase n=1 Tax=Cupriavidus sp. UME77 TaxID=1862321 RepID=UPI001602A763|nr:S8 family serine peptidase [Cupriavidus sp. UME77]MBB1634363.1 peptidase S8 [Cupriavidus sp. UME77]